MNSFLDVVYKPLPVRWRPRPVIRTGLLGFWAWWGYYRGLSPEDRYLECARMRDGWLMRVWHDARAAQAQEGRR